ncbi:spermidine/putrescine ABC transporter substrate-binding protein [Synechococcus sp. CS-1325]|uniref:ABC transporter substrate-binding protein n=1 Tax=unclassified Synechococcus TaxID=2626047 RepID=UPI000DAFD41E|nr:MULTISPECIES: spermidine/putrescine ABC transporter substrate-binding protein [unclassified Synechococcus]MCT0200158.1 spermidine/putrescine ABC transporter substrate-binding protein [Synechococcus sp. CS-1325]MCT0212699.1 spermidine/putrescine ABC transporter substrate-binding protein [Synechococcus sp. CS-1326]MCT0233707.1 spermidine/putrescine ABC transporter substrate-binding protein [Synechococcus sp. CS-1327]PZV01277.1 MAG: ABC transporter substrate-binding protein [Cyanobium sp.]
MPLPLSPRLTRRTLLRRLTLAGAAAAVGPGLLAACRGGGGPGAADGDARGSLVISNWPIYIDPSQDGVPGTVERFTKQTGIPVTYNEDYNDNDAFFAKIQPVLAAGKTIPQNIFVTTYWMAQRLIDLGWVEALPLDAVPNAANLIPTLRKPSWDPTGAFSLPWQSGIAGIAYNSEVTGRELDSMDDLFDPAFKGKVGFLTEMRDTIGLLMLADGKDPGQPSYAAAEPSFKRLEQAKQNGQIRAFTGNDYQDDLLAGNFAACVAWSGDVAQLALEQPKLRFVVPESGGMLFTDVMVMPKGASHPAAVAEWMNFVYTPAEAARIAAAVQYITPVEGVQQLLAKDPATRALAANPLNFPDAALEARLKIFGPLTPSEEVRFNERFATIISG